MKSDDRLDLLAECEVETFKSGGKGGQHQNKTESAVRLRHRLTGATAICRDERSQYLNKMRCLEILEQKIAKLREKPKFRVPTTTPKSKKRKMLATKHRTGLKKQLRKKPAFEE